MERQLIEEEDDDLDEVRLIFNEGLEFLTKPIARITKADHLRWWRELSQLPRRLVFLYREEERSIGYLVMRWQESGVIRHLMGTRARERGKGYGMTILGDCVALADAPITGEILKSNVACQRIHEAHGFRCIHDAGDILHYRWDPP